MTDPTKQFEKPAVACFHGGQSYRYCKSFICDFSVTTNLSGPPTDALAAASKAFDQINDYPDQDSWEARCHLAEMIHLPPSQILIGNGASEFIDMVPRMFQKGQKWRPGKWPAQFMEYERAALNAGLIKTPWENNEAELTIMINPNSPTGDYIPIDELREIIARDSKSTFLIDESFIMCIGPDWMNHSALTLIHEFGDRVIICSSWTKVLACPFIRLGTLYASENIISKIVEFQVPWSVNNIAQDFFIAALHQTTYFTEMWRVTPKWKKITEALLQVRGFKPNPNSPSWVPFVYVDMLSDEIAARANQVAFEAGVPLRHCASFGQPRFVRLGVRLPEYVYDLANALEQDPVIQKLLAELKQ